MRKIDRKHLERVKMLPCCVCGAEPPSDAHHCLGYEFGTGKGLKASDYKTIPLCKSHHQDGGFGVAFHAGSKTWEKNHGFQRDHLARTLEKLKESE